jgi:UDPglucose 6-dehydrogenase
VTDNSKATFASVKLERRVKIDKQASHPIFAVDSEQYINYISTAPTTPDGSLTFNPVVQAIRLHEALEDASVRGGTTREILLAFLSETAPGAHMTRNIYCIGAGYVVGRIRYNGVD